MRRVLRMNGIYNEFSSDKYLSPLLLEWLDFAFWLEHILAVCGFRQVSAKSESFLHLSFIVCKMVMIIVPAS